MCKLFRKPAVIFGIVYFIIAIFLYLASETYFIDDKIFTNLPSFLNRPISTGAADFLILCLVVVCTAFLIIFWRYVDRNEPESRWVFLVLFMGGIIATVMVTYAAYFLYNVFTKSFHYWPEHPTYIIFVGPILEELIKATVVALFIYKLKSCNQIRDGLIYGAVLGTGFAFSEGLSKTWEILFTKFPHDNMLSIVTTASMTLGAFIKVSAHAATTGLLGYFFAKHKFLGNRQLLPLSLGLFLAITFHGTSNALTFADHPFYAIIEVGLVFIILLTLASRLESEKVYPAQQTFDRIISNSSPQ